MSKFETGDIIKLRNNSEYCYLDFSKSFFDENGRRISSSVFYNGYKYKSDRFNNDNNFDVVLHKRGDKVLYQGFKFEVPTEDTPIDTRVLVWDGTASFQEVKNANSFCNRHFNEMFENNKFICFVDGLTKFTSDNKLEAWDNAVIYEDGMLD